MAKKAGSEVTTAWIRYSQAKALAGEYLGDPEVAEREIRKGLAAGIPWRCVRFEAPLQYSGPGPGDPKFWREPDNLLPASFPPVVRLDWLVIKGDYARHINGAAALGVELDRSALVRLKLLPPDDIDGDAALAKVYAPRVARDLKRAGKLDQVNKKKNSHT